MSYAGRPYLDAEANIAAMDAYATACGLPAYGVLMRALHAQEQRSAELYAALRESAEHSGAVQLALFRTGPDQPREALERSLTEALERSAAAVEAADVALFTAETRVDLDGRKDVTVLAEARARLRPAGRRL
jgi:hypothetical protein